MIELTLLRKFLNIKQRELARQLGFSPTKLSLLENSKIRPREEDVEKIKQFFRGKINGNQTQNTQNG